MKQIIRCVGLRFASAQLGARCCRRLYVNRYNIDSCYCQRLLSEFPPNCKNMAMASSYCPFSRSITACRYFNSMAEMEGVDERMKENEQMEWVRRMEMICGRVEEVMCEEIIG